MTIQTHNEAALLLSVGLYTFLTEEIMRQPSVFKASAIKHWDLDKKLPNGAWVPARPEGGGFSWRWRWKLAIDVLFGRADALFWD